MSIRIEEKFLRQVSRKVIEEDLPLLNKITEKINLFWEQGWTAGVGLATIQVGYNVRFAIYEQPQTKKRIQLINPVITEKRGMRTFRREGCLSVPNCRVNTHRYANIAVRNGFNEEETIIADGFEAQIIQHEIDHMDGILCLDREIAPFKDQPRNEPCACGSGMKFKKCHGA